MPKILIVDDEPFTVEMLQTFLQINGYEAVGALNGQDGIVLSQVESPDILILDLMLPDLEGYDVCRRLRNFPPTSQLPVLILSARTAQVDKDKALAAGANGYLTKPVRFPELLSELRRLPTPLPPIEPAPGINSPPIPGQTSMTPTHPTQLTNSAAPEFGTSTLPPQPAT
jgi:DNA-binding response OmpR family regulator